VSRADAIGLLIVVAALVAGLLVGQRWVTRVGPLDESGFRLWLWEQRGLDLAVQMGLILSGALGIAALLPSEEDQP